MKRRRLNVVQRVKLAKWVTENWSTVTAKPKVTQEMVAAICSKALGFPVVTSSLMEVAKALDKTWPRRTSNVKTVRLLNLMAKQVANLTTQIKQLTTEIEGK